VRKTQEGEGLHTNEHDRWLEAWVLGDEGAIPAPLAAELEGCTTCSAKRRELSAIMGALTEEGRAEAADIDAALRTKDVPGIEQGEAALRGIIPVRSGAKPTSRAGWRTSRLVRRVVLAAAALIALVGIAWIFAAERGGKGGDMPLGEDENEIVIVGPKDRVGSFAHFEWRYHLELGGSFTVMVYAAGHDPRQPLLEVPVKTQAHAWNPTKAEQERFELAKDIEWEVRASDSNRRFSKSSGLVPASCSR
jgi:hypothetical protein